MPMGANFLLIESSHPHKSMMVPDPRNTGKSKSLSDAYPSLILQDRNLN